MLTVPAPAMNVRDGVGAAVAAALGIDPRQVMLSGDQLHIDVPDTRKAEAEAAVAGHVPPAPPEVVDPVAVLLAEVNRASTTAAKVNALVAHLPAALRRQ